MFLKACSVVFGPGVAWEGGGPDCASTAAIASANRMANVCPKQHQSRHLPVHFVLSLKAISGPMQGLEMPVEA